MSQMNILNDNGKYFFFNALTIEKRLAPKNYLFNFDDKGNAWLEEMESFKLPKKIYDVDSDLRDLVRLSFKKYNKNLGVLLTGNKGQGKSLTAKMICVESALPTIVFNKPIPSEVNFSSFLNNIKQDYVLFIDEFEKLFDMNSKNDKEKNYHTQESFLSFIDGVFTNDNKILFLFTTNDSVNEFLINRPSRIKFLKEYVELPEELFDMIVEDRLNDKSLKEDLKNSISFINLNIDLLINIIDDINTFKKPFSSFAHLYNYRLEQYKYDIYVTEKGKKEMWEKTHVQSHKIKAKDGYVGEYDVESWVKFTKDEVVFESSKYNGKKEVDIQVRATLSKITSTASQVL